MPPHPPLDTLLPLLTRTLPLSPSPAYLTSLLPLLPPQPTPAATLASLRFRLLTSDFTQSLLPHAHTTFPPDMHTSARYQAAAPGVALPGPIAAQVVDVEDLGTSMMERLERAEMEGRGEVLRGREVIRVVPPEEGEGRVAAPPGQPSRGPHKLLLEDARGGRAWAFELDKIPGVEIGGRMKLGAKLVMRDVPVIRGLLMLQPGNTTFLEGKIEAWDVKWAERRREKLDAAVGVGREGGEAGGGA